jgi:hypothetical protein
VSSSPWEAWKIQRTCGRKTRYAHEGQAKREGFKKYGQHMRAYRCPHCDRWHITKADAS